jgi:hypothetical protein
MTPAHQLEIFNTVKGLKFFPVAVRIFFVFDQIALLRVPGQTLFIPERLPGMMDSRWRGSGLTASVPVPCLRVSSLNTLTARVRLPACSCIASAEAAASSTGTAFCCVDLSIRMIA